ncbi:hypothetical protein [Bacillus sp. AFS023182]|uniref:hypothetical protein n=1 Tax=Bacillus sp. AFS023182 TaxID=2033492 RepID=UPI003F8D85BB
MKEVKYTYKELASIKTELKIAKDSWQDLENYADKLYEDAKIIKIDPPIEGSVKKGQDCT